MARVDTTARLARLRELMRERQIDVYVIPSEDSHASEYIAQSDARREYISGFTGSAGCAVVTLNKAALATDGRYFNQASSELDSNWLLLKQGMPDVLTWQEWVAVEASNRKIVAVDPHTIPGSLARTLADKIRRWGGTELRALDENLVDLVWGSNRPQKQLFPIKLHHERFAGESTSLKLDKIRKELVKRMSPALVISALDDVAWLFNLRGADIPFNPVFFGYAVVSRETASLYVDSRQLGAECQRYLANNRIEVLPYDAALDSMRELGKTLTAVPPTPGQPLPRFLLPNSASWALKLALGGDDAVDQVRSIVGDLKTVKNSAELEGMRACHRRDGMALIEFMAWLEDQLVAKKATLDEVDAAEKLETIRSRLEHHVGPSFPTISATGANAAVIHYHAEKGSCSVIDPDAVYLCDTGAQYLDGTTDTTRTVHFGTPTDAQRRAYTLVLKGHIALDMAVFPKGTIGSALDWLARQYLAREGLNYRHGTGHGVGSYLNVHEGPIGIRSPTVADKGVPLQAGNVTSIEPGYYEDGSFGIRLENVAIVVQVKTANCFGGEPYLGFEHVTMVPFCRNLIEPGLLTEEERGWLNRYHAKVLESMDGAFEGDALTRAWLAKETQLF